MNKKLLLLIISLTIGFSFFMASDAPFSMVAAATTPSITILLPNGGEQISQGQTSTIQWSMSGTNTNDSVTIDLIYPDGRFLYTIYYTDRLNTTSYNWDRTSAIQLGQYKIRITVYDPITAVTISDTSDAPFSIVAAPAIQVLSPNNGDIWQIGQTYTVRWFSSLKVSGGTVHLIGTINGVAVDKYLGSSESNSFNYTVPSSISPGNWTLWVCGELDCADKDSGFGDSRQIIITAATIPIPQPTITVLSPNGGETWQIPLFPNIKNYDITWKSSNVDAANIYLKFPDGTTCFIASVVPAAVGKYEMPLQYNMPLPCSGTTRTIVPGNYQIAIWGDKTAYDSSDATFSIAAACLPDGTLIKTPEDPKVYLIIDCQKQWIKTQTEFKQAGFQWFDVKEVNSAVVQSYADYLQATANLLRVTGQDKVYQVINGKVLWIPSAAAFSNLGLNWDDMEVVSSAILNQYPRAKLLQVAGDSKVYYITESGLKRHIPNEQVFSSYNNNWPDIVKVAPSVLNVFPDNNLIQGQTDTKVYKLENGQKHWIKTPDAFNRLNLDWTKIASVNSTELAAYPEGAPIE